MSEHVTVYLLQEYLNICSDVVLKCLQLFCTFSINSVAFSCLVEELEEEEEDNEDDMECDKALSEEDSDGEEADEDETMTVVSEAPIPDDKYDKHVNFTEEQDTLIKTRGQCS